MYISNISINGYKNACNVASVKLNKGLNVLLGENGCGKSSILLCMSQLIRKTSLA